MIKFNCPHCDKPLKAINSKAGSQQYCPDCGESITIPRRGQIQPDGVILLSKRFEDRELRPFPPGEVIAESWKLFSSQMGLLIPAFLVNSALTGLALGLGLVPSLVTLTILRPDKQFETILAYGGASIFILPAIAFLFYLQTGYLILVLKLVRRQPVDWSDLFSGGRFWVRMTICSMVFGLVTGIGYAACFVPGLLLSAIFLPYAYVLIDEDIPGLGCLSRAKELTDGNWGSLLLIVLISYGCNYVSSLFCYVGLIFTIPYTTLLNAMVYVRMSRQLTLNQIPESDD